MHRNRIRYIMSNEGKLQAINESGIGRDMNDNEIAQFKSEIERQLAVDPNNQGLKRLYQRFPSKGEQIIERTGAGSG